MIIIRQLLNEHLFEYPSDQLHLSNLLLFLLIHLQVVSDPPLPSPTALMNVLIYTSQRFA